MNYRQTFDRKKSGEYKTFRSWSISQTLSLIYSHQTFCPARSNLFTGHLSKLAGHVQRVFCKLRHLDWFIIYSLQESYTYRDPITEFLECLYVNFDFDGAQQKLRECETVSLYSYSVNIVFNTINLFYWRAENDFCIGCITLHNLGLSRTKPSFFRF